MLQRLRLRLGRRGSELSVITVIAITASARAAAACECVSASAESAATAADVVFVGRVVAMRVGERYAWPEVEFSLDERLKGQVPSKKFVLHTAIGRGSNCEGFPFSVGEEYLVFAAARHSVVGWPNTYGVSYCMGTTALDSTGKRRLRETRAFLRRR